MKSTLRRDNPYMSMVENIMRTGWVLDRKVSEVLKEFSITHVQFNLLRILEEKHPNAISVSEIGEELLFHTSDITRMLDRLDKHDLVIRKICPKNRRKMDVMISNKGMEVLSDSVPKIAEKLENYYEEKISSSERDVIEEIMKRLKD